MAVEGKVVEVKRGEPVPAHVHVHVRAHVRVHVRVNTIAALFDVNIILENTFM